MNHHHLQVLVMINLLSCSLFTSFSYKQQSPSSPSRFRGVGYFTFSGTSIAISFCPFALNLFVIALKWTSFTFHQTEQGHHPGPRFSDIFHQRYMFRLMAQGIRRFSLFTTRISHLLLHTLGHDGNPNSPFRWISIKQRHIMMST